MAYFFYINVTAEERYGYRYDRECEKGSRTGKGRIREGIYCYGRGKEGIGEEYNPAFRGAVDGADGAGGACGGGGDREEGFARNAGAYCGRVRE